MKLKLAAVMFLGFSVPAFAQMPPFDAIDTDGNGTVSIEEAKAAMPDMTDDQWKSADANGDGQMSQEEYNQMPGK